ncbi:MAG TPA: hypothetical protein VE869_10750 [Gemmatimonas sp.]|nr:hypothetical protein [Gemmatimonas sp.]
MDVARVGKAELPAAEVRVSRTVGGNVSSLTACELHDRHRTPTSF